LINDIDSLYVNLGGALNKKIHKYVKWAGGPSHVARTLKLSRTTIWPDSEFSGRTNYARRLTKMCRDNGYTLAFNDVLQAGRP